LGWLQEKVAIKITKRCKIRFTINVDNVDEVECDAVPLNACELMFGNICLWDRDETLHMNENKQCLVKIGDPTSLKHAKA
jgi:hypothetical protein